MPEEWRRGAYVISTDPERVQIQVVHAFLTTAYWCEGISRELVERASRNSLCFGVYRDDEQVGFARVVTDRATFGYLLDVFVLPDHRGRGVARWLIATILAHPELQGFRRWMLGTKDAHPLYASVGFVACANPERVMEIVDPDAYRRGATPR